MDFEFVDIVGGQPQCIETPGIGGFSVQVGLKLAFRFRHSFCEKSYKIVCALQALKLFFHAVPLPWSPTAKLSRCLHEPGLTLSAKDISRFDSQRSLEPTSSAVTNLRLAARNHSIQA